MSVISRGVAIANRVTKKLKMQSSVTLKSLTGDSGRGDDAFSSKPLTAIVDKKQRVIRAFDGTEKVSGTTVTFLDPGVVVGENDIIRLADGSGGPVLGVGGFVDGSTDRQALTEAYLG
jgi:hypothetical protein